MIERKEEEELSIMEEERKSRLIKKHNSKEYYLLGLETIKTRLLFILTNIYYDRSVNDSKLNQHL